MNGAPPLLTLYAPLLGASFDSENRGLIAGNVFANILYQEEWKAVQKTDVMLEQFDGSPPPPVCLTVFERRSADEDLPSGPVQRTGGC